MFKRIAVPAIATMLSFVLLFAVLASPFLLFFTLGPPPCQDETWFYEVTRLAVPAALLAGAVWMYRIRHRPNVLGFLAALAIPAIAVGLNAVASHSDAALQASCSKRGLHEAMATCGANPAHYREGRDQYGYAVLTLIASGNTDRAWNCLWTWSIHNGSVSMKVDENVYEHYRRTHAAAPNGN